MTRDCSMCGATIENGYRCSECGRDQSDGIAVKQVATDGSGANAGEKPSPSGDGYLPADIWVTIAAAGTALIAGYVGYAVMYLQWEWMSLFPFPVISTLTFVFLVRKESPKKAAGIGFYIIAALLILWTARYMYGLAGAGLLAAPMLLGAAVAAWAFTLAGIAAVLGLLLNRSAENSSS